MSDNILNVSRRGFLQGMVSTGALVLSVRLVPDFLWAAETGPATHADRAVLHPSAFVGIDTDGTVYIVAHRSEMGTSSRTSVPLILADELDADWKRVKLEQAIGDPRYGDQDTDGSHSVREFLRSDARSWSHGAPDADPGGRQAMGSAGIGVPFRSARHRSQPEQSQSRLRRTGGRRRKVAGSQERRTAIQAEERVAIHRQRRYQLRPGRYLHRQSGLWHGRSHWTAWSTRRSSILPCWAARSSHTTKKRRCK